MSAPQVARLQALLSRVQDNRAKPRTAPNGTPAPLQSARTADAEPGFFAPSAQDSVDTTPPPASFAKPQPAAARNEPAPARNEPAPAPARNEPAQPRPEPVRMRPAIEAEHVRVPDLKPATLSRGGAPERPMPAPARPTAPGATPLEMALEGEVARAAESAAMASAVPARGEAEVGPRLLADPTPPQPTRPIVQAVTTHPPVQPNSFGELLKRSLALRPR